MISVKELRKWLTDCERNVDESLDESQVFIEEGGLTLRIEYDLAELYLEVGGHAADPSGQACPVCRAAQDCRDDCPNKGYRMGPPKEDSGLRLHLADETHVRRGFWSRLYRMVPGR